MKRVNLEASSQRSRLVEEVEGAAVRPRVLGQFAGEATTHADFDELPADIAAAFGA